jgi:cytochrome c553
MKAILFLASIFQMLVTPLAAAEITGNRFDELKMDCDTCHGVNGVSPTPDQVPSIAGKSGTLPGKPTSSLSGWKAAP